MHDEQGPHFLPMIALVGAVVAAVILFFFVLGYLLGRFVL